MPKHHGNNKYGISVNKYRYLSNKYGMIGGIGVIITPVSIQTG